MGVGVEAVARPLLRVVPLLFSTFFIAFMSLVFLFGSLLWIRIEGFPCLLRVGNVSIFLQQSIKEPHPLGPSNEVNMLVVYIGPESLNCQPLVRVDHLGVDVAEVFDITFH